MTSANDTTDLEQRIRQDERERILKIIQSLKSEYRGITQAVATLGRLEREIRGED